MPVTADILLSYVYLYSLLTFLHDVNFKSLVSLSIWNRLRAHRVLREKTWCTENVLFWMTSWALPQVLQRTKSLPFNSLKFSSRLEIRFKLPFIKVTEWRETGLSRVSFREIAEGTVVRWVWSKLAKTQSRRALGFQHSIIHWPPPEKGYRVPTMSWALFWVLTAEKWVSQQALFSWRSHSSLNMKRGKKKIKLFNRQIRSID